jgi:hypothetical protein
LAHAQATLPFLFRNLRLPSSNALTIFADEFSNDGIKITILVQGVISGHQVVGNLLARLCEHIGIYGQEPTTDLKLMFFDKPARKADHRYAIKFVRVRGHQERLGGDDAGCPGIAELHVLTQHLFELPSAAEPAS